VDDNQLLAGIDLLQAVDGGLAKAYREVMQGCDKAVEWNGGHLYVIWWVANLPKLAERGLCILLNSNSTASGSG
jgi:hypothetical protein